MTAHYRIRYKTQNLEVEVESSDHSYVDETFEKLIGLDAAELTPPEKRPSARPRKKKASGSAKPPPSSASEGSDAVDIATIVASINDDDDYEAIDKHILGKSAQLPKIILCLKAASDNGFEYLTTGQIESVTDQLRIKIATANAGSTIKKNQKYFAQDSVRKKGAIVKYKLNRKGIEAYSKLVSGEKL